MEDEILHLSMKQLADDDRPREKLMLHGRKALSDAELIALLLRSGTTKETAVQLAQRILSAHKNNLHEIAKLTVNDFMKFKGIGEAKAVSIIAALELGRRRKESEILQYTLVKTSADAYHHIAAQLSDLPHEEFWVMLLNRANKITKTELVGRGGVTGTVADVRLIIKLAVENLASSLVVAHNHPSGNLRPSDCDIQLTRKIKEGAQLFDISLVDHIIVGNSSYYSFNDDGIL